MYTIEEKILRSFKALKTDIIKIQDEIMQISNSHDDMLRQVIELKDKKSVKKSSKKKVAKKNIVKKKSSQKIAKKVISVKPKVVNKYVAAKSGKKFHIEACPFAKNILPKSKIKISNKNDALNKGYKPCSCVTSI